MSITATYKFCFYDQLVIDGVVVAPEIELEGEADYRYSPGSSAYFDRSFGNWLPGDDPEVEITDIRLFGKAVGAAKDAPMVTVELQAGPLFDRISEYLTDNCVSDLCDEAEAA